ncbi:hypothetical protein PHLGIDRAFT_338620 [Phlebiopsis gigantea 11061_1 CR5-6]|uniref:Uncharacterized protein n=1 Tax=Phlebiopsis gigantea (strain 11061_1 CR5-6) TaxID=745531 RepID=A0A0C3NV89_PHLG1|nr:hypothetical protein PHLGIDRAFT_338620 [Phlebiopsis gigantea 11061_1 CR5-6]
MSLPPSDRWTYDMMPPPVENQGTLIRQIEYRAPNQPQDFNRQSMSFKLTNSTRPGIRLSHATDAAVLRLLEQGEEPLPITMRSKMSIRIQPEGYSTNFSVQKQSDWWPRS